MNEKPKIMAALAVIVKNHQVLVGKRNADRIYAGWWEFPGGKIEPGESAAAACKREAMEELGDRIQLGPQVMPEYARPQGAETAADSAAITAAGGLFSQAC